MATVEAQRLTVLHRQQQSQVSTATALLMLRLYAALDPNDLDGTTSRWLELILPVLRRNRALSAALASRYLAAYRRLELPDALEDFIPEPRGDLDVDRVIASMMVTGPVELRKQLRQRREQDLPERLAPADLEKAAAKVARSAIRHVREGERETLYEGIKADPRALGYMRVSDGDPCYFCAMLVSRGPVYRDDSFADSDPRFHGPGQHKVHDGCGCSVEPVYTRVTEPGSLQQTTNDLWIASTKGASGKDAILAFRRAYEGRSGGPQ